MNIRERYNFYWKLVEKEGSHAAAVERLCGEIECICHSSSSDLVYLAAIVRNMVGNDEFTAAIQKAGGRSQRSYYQILTLIPLTEEQYISLGFSLLLFIHMTCKDEVLYELIK